MNDLERKLRHKLLDLEIDLERLRAIMSKQSKKIDRVYRLHTDLARQRAHYQTALDRVLTQNKAKELSK